MFKIVVVFRPLWMMESFNEDTQQIDDQFLIGDEVLVAPVLKFGQRTRDVYFPKFDNYDFEVFWRRGSDGKRFKGGEWARDMKVKMQNFRKFFKLICNRLYFQVDLHDILYFIREKDY